MSRVTIKWSAVAGLIAVGASLALARVHPFGDAGLYGAKGAERPILNRSQMPDEVRAILVEKCADCHSNQTRAPLYGHFAPVSWLMERDIVGARKVMNLSLWESYSPDQQQTFAAKIARETETHDMPPVQYRMIHWNARIADGNSEVLKLWAQGSQPTQASGVPPGEGDPARGRQLFEKRCTGCHTLTQNREGPRLQGVYGRTSGTVADFAYSVALKRAKIVWDEATLEKWLTDPDTLISGNEMDFLVSNPQQRHDLISYLKRNSVQ